MRDYIGSRIRIHALGFWLGFRLFKGSRCSIMSGGGKGAMMLMMLGHWACSFTCSFVFFFCLKERRNLAEIWGEEGRGG